MSFYSKAVGALFGTQGAARKFGGSHAGLLGKAGGAVAGGWGFSKLSDYSERRAQAYYGKSEFAGRFGGGFGLARYGGYAAMGAGLFGAPMLARGASRFTRGAAARRMGRVVGPKTMGKAGKLLKWGSPFAGLMAIGAVSSGFRRPTHIAEGNILSINRQPVASRMNFRTAGISMR